LHCKAPANHEEKIKRFNNGRNHAPGSARRNDLTNSAASASKWLLSHYEEKRMAVHLESVEKAERIARQSANDLQGIKTQVQTLAEVIAEIGRYQRRLDEQVSTISASVKQLVTAIQALDNRR
jgi:hypothetical protein